MTVKYSDIVTYRLLRHFCHSRTVSQYPIITVVNSFILLNPTPGEDPVRGNGGFPALVQAAQHPALQGRGHTGLPARGSGRLGRALRDEQLPADVQELLQGRSVEQQTNWALI